MNYTFSDINAIDLNNPVGLVINGEHICNTNFDGSNVYIENEFIGIIGGEDVNSMEGLCAGVSGSFYYENNLFSGLGDDVANNIVNGPDAIADIQPYLTTDSQIDVSFVYQSFDNPPHPNAPLSNVIWQMYLVYTSNCENVEVSIMTSDTTTCANSPLQLGASGGIAYNWLPQNNLSCYDCPNPVFLGDSTINYTVRIWSTDSCSVVKPLRVRVVPQPNFENINVTKNICGYEVGTIAGTSTGLSLPLSYQINNSTPQSNFNFSNLEAGIYTITVTDANGCSRDSTVQILEVNNVQAAFSVNPNSGAAPLTVQTQNTSQNATEYQWFWGDEISTLQNPSISLDTAGIYTLTLVASNGAAHCNDTATALIFVEEPFVVFAYSYVTDEADVYQIFLSGVSEYHYDLYALDGKLVYRQNGNIEAAGYADLWEISWVSSGMYVFRVKVKDNAGNEQEVEGKVVVVR
jgi:PKD repeat protein